MNLMHDTLNKVNFKNNNYLAKFLQIHDMVDKFELHYGKLDYVEEQTRKQNANLRQIIT
jgi:hypothetical protein